MEREANLQRLIAESSSAEKSVRLILDRSKERLLECSRDELLVEVGMLVERIAESAKQRDAAVSRMRHHLAEMGLLGIQAHREKVETEDL